MDNMDKLPTQKLYIHGAYTDASSQQEFSNISPVNGQSICQVQIAGSDDVERAVASSSEGFARWSVTSTQERSRVLHKAAQILRSRIKELAHLEVLDSGKPITEALSTDIISSAEALEYFAGIASTLHGHHYDLPTAFVYTKREPLGVCAGIGAWNYPLQIACWKSAPALACGNAMVFKPSELTPLTALKLAEIYSEAGLPAGVFNVINGFAQVGQALASHPQVKKISLTGSVATGKKIMATAAQSLKTVTLELGGKSPLIIFADCDLEKAVSTAVLANFYTQGEICSNGTRVFVEEAIYPEFITRLQREVKALKVGNPFAADTQMGALISKAHLQKVLGYIGKAQQEGAQLLCGGKEIIAAEGGFYLQPTVFIDCQDHMTHVQEEIFGPVMSVLSFQSEEEVIKRANNSLYGLAAGVFTSQLARAHRVVGALEAGTCWINNYNITPMEMPFGGYKQSGLGRENSLLALEHYTQVKSVYVEK
jgi:betaine-aldehyde dehydrogenase